MNVTICGGGNGAHTWAGVTSSLSSARVTVLDVYQNEAEIWTDAKAKRGFCVQYTDGSTLFQEPGKVKFDVTKAAADCIPEADIVIVCVPAYTHEMYLNLIAPLLRDDCVVVGAPGHPGFEYQCADILRSAKKRCPFVSLETLPWACRILNYGYQVQVVGTKQEVDCSVVDQNNRTSGEGCAAILAKLQNLLGKKPVLKLSHSPLECTLLGKSTIHPPIMYARWRAWTGGPLETPPLFYQGVDEAAVQYLDDVNIEIMNAAEEISRRYPRLKLSGEVTPMKQWFLDHYGDQIDDKTSLLSCLQTNRAYTGLLHPMTPTTAGFVPNFEYRYTTEDIPYGLVVLRQITHMVGVATPVMDEIITWAQEKMGTCFLESGNICVVDRACSRIFKNYGINNIDDLVNYFPK